MGIMELGAIGGLVGDLAVMASLLFVVGVTVIGSQSCVPRRAIELLAVGY